MPSFAGGALRFTATFFYAIEFCCAGIILGVYSYYLARLSSNDLPISNDWKAVEGLSGATVLYTLIATLLTCFLGGVKLFAFLGVFFDVLFCGAFIAIAILARGGASSCSGSNLSTPLGTGPSSENNPYYGKNNFGFPPSSNTQGYTPNLHLACRLNTASFAVAIIGAVLMIVSAFFQVLVSRHHQKEKRFGPSPQNNYTSGSAGGRKFWQRKPKTTRDAYARDVEVSEQPPTLTTGTATDFRPSHETGTTMGDSQQKFSDPNPYESTPGGAYHTGPRGTAVPGATNF